MENLISWNVASVGNYEIIVPLNDLETSASHVHRSC